MKTWHIQIEGLVQGVGFRPFSFSLAHKFEIKGWVKNARDGVHIVFNADQKLALGFRDALVEKAPRLSKITTITLTETEAKRFDDFQILNSDHSGNPVLLLTPDFALCQDCRVELTNESNRRHGYPFITCTNCGPRFSIVRRLPYDRENTTMDAFRMCANCSEEYENPNDRRFAAQTNSCPNCKIELSLFDNQQRLVSTRQNDIIDQVIHYWRTGKIVAIKGLGGYLLTCDASNKDSVIELRKRKNRPAKPFALMAPDLEYVSCLVDLKDSEKTTLISPAAPIVLLDFEKGDTSNLAKNEIAPNTDLLGLMLPNTPLYELLLQKFGQPIVATSGNMSSAPIIYEDQKAVLQFSNIADYVLVNSREILLPQDDSVVKFSPFTNHKIIVRRSRGMAPTYINKELKTYGEGVLALGAMMKSTFSLLHQNNIYISQYLGDLENFDCQESFKHVIQHLLTLLATKPELILLDKNQAYPSSVYGTDLAKKLNIPTKAIQHHKSHFAAVLGEHGLIDTQEPILGLVWDGTGVGDDGQIWGGEFFVYDQFEIHRHNHFEYFDFIAGDKMPREPRISALTTCWGVKRSAEILKEKFTSTEWKVYTKLLEGDVVLQTSSVGRIFDAVASILGIMDIQTYEGEAAIQIELKATQYFKIKGLDFKASYFKKESQRPISTKSIIAQIVQDRMNGDAVECIAAKFHNTLVQIIESVAREAKIKKLAFSGGVFQNALLVDLIQHQLEGDFDLYFHQELAPNDENISFGQIVCDQIQRLKFTA